MGRIAKVLSFLRRIKHGAHVSDVKINPGGGANDTAEHFSAPGDDSYPLDTDYALAVGINRSGVESVAGYVDPLNVPKATAGDKRIYARDPSTGLMVVELWLKSDGSSVLTNGLGTLTLLADGSFNINGVIIDPSGNVIVPTSLIVAGKELAGHDHAINSGSSAPGPTGGNN